MRGSYPPRVANADRAKARLDRRTSLSELVVAFGHVIVKSTNVPVLSYIRKNCLQHILPNQKETGTISGILWRKDSGWWWRRRRRRKGSSYAMDSTHPQWSKQCVSPLIRNTTSSLTSYKSTLTRHYNNGFHRQAAMLIAMHFIGVSTEISILRLIPRVRSRYGTFWHFIVW